MEKEIVRKTGSEQTARILPDSYDSFSLPQKYAVEPKEWDVFALPRKGEPVDYDIFSLN